MESASYHGALRVEAVQERDWTAKAQSTTSHDSANQSVSERLKGIYERSRYLAFYPQSEADRLLYEYRLRLSRDEDLETTLYPFISRITHIYRLDKRLRFKRAGGAK